MRKVAENTIDGNTLRVYRDVEWDEYVVRFYAAGVHQVNADYFTDNKREALDMLNNPVNYVFTKG